jgi:hypothetical protein
MSQSWEANEFQAATGTEAIAGLTNATLTLRIARRAFLIMGDKSPKANQKHKAQQKAKANSAAQKKEQASAAKAAPRKK